MIQKNVGIGEFYVSSRMDEVIKTYALGSCVAVIMYDKVNKVAGMIHIALPDSEVNPKKAETRPGFFADTGLPLFLQQMKKQGAVRTSTSIKLAGGASIMDEKNTFDIGRRNAIAIKRYLWKKGLGVIKEDIGGKISRTVTVDVSSGNVSISNSKESWTL